MLRTSNLSSFKFFQSALLVLRFSAPLSFKVPVKRTFNPSSTCSAGSIIITFNPLNLLHTSYVRLGVFLHHYHRRYLVPSQIRMAMDAVADARKLSLFRPLGTSDQSPKLLLKLPASRVYCTSCWLYWSLTL